MKKKKKKTKIRKIVVFLLLWVFCSHFGADVRRRIAVSGRGHGNATHQINSTGVQSVRTTLK
jgi:hypothetical protein